MRNIVKVVLISLISLVIFWSPFLLKISDFGGINFNEKGMETIVQNFDGLNFLVVERTWYQPEKIEELNRSFLTNRDPVYFSAHYPLFAAVVWVFDSFTTGPNALLLSVIVSNALMAWAMYSFFLVLVKSKNKAFALTIIGLFMPARMLSVRAVASTEMIFIALSLSSLTYYMKGKNWLAAALGALAVLTRSPGILLFGAYAMAEIIKNKKQITKSITTLLPYYLIPLSLAGLWMFYGVKYGSFWAYFQSGDNLHLFFPPFQFFSNTQTWVGGMWREDAIYIYLLLAFGVYRLFKKYREKKYLAVKYYALIYLVIIMFIAHRDLARYSLPLAPLALVGYVDVITDKKIRWILIFMLIPIYLLGWNFVLENVQLVNDWSVFL